MTKIIYAFVLSSLLLLGCKNDDESLSPEQLNTLKWTKNWNLGTNGYVLVDGQDITSQYAGFDITFESNGDRNIFQAVNGQNAFPVSLDTWNFTDESYTSIVRGSDGVIITGVIEENTLVMNLSIPIPPNGRVEGTYGNFEFSLETED